MLNIEYKIYIKHELFYVTSSKAYKDFLVMFLWNNYGVKAIVKCSAHGIYDLKPIK